MTTTKILVVDDDDSIRIVISEMLSMMGYDVQSAGCGEDGLFLFLRNEIDFVLSDFQMPGMNGLVFAGCIKKASPHTPVVIMTGSGKGFVSADINTSVEMVIEKPFPIKKLDETIRKYTEKTFQANPYPHLNEHANHPIDQSKGVLAA